ncbi:MAG: DNA internalization-related competence protein ComEC/Rec2 [Pseudomonadota bacterium]
MDSSARAEGAPLAPVLLGAVLGPAVQLQQAALWAGSRYLIVLIAGCALAVAARAGRNRLHGLFRAALWLTAAAACTFATTGLRSAAYIATALDPSLEGRDLRITGIVAAMPQRDDGGTRLRFEVEDAKDADAASVRLPPQLLLGWYNTGPVPAADGRFELQRQSADLRPGERWQFTARLKAPHGNLNPHGFDYELWLWEQGLQATGYVRAGPRDAPPQRIGRTWRHPVEQARHAVREAILQRVTDRRWAGVLAALVVGDQAAIERADWDIFRATGVAHLMSISGLHITMFAWAAAALIGALWRRSTRLCLAWPAQHAALVGGIALAAAYAVFSGWGVPSQRTVWMLATIALLRLSGRAWPWPPVWLLACAAVVALDPWALTQAGFWLSFVAVGVLFATDLGRGAAPAGARQRILATLREQWVVTVALTPLTLLLFGQVSVVGLAANLVAIPWVTLVVTPLAMAGVLVAPAWDLAAWAVQGLALVLQWLAALPFATLSVPTAPLWAAAAGLAGGVLLAMPLPAPLRLLGLPLMLPVLLWQAPRPPMGEFDLLAADVGQGNAVIVRTATHTLVYDAGPRYSQETDAGQRVLVPLLRQAGERVDTLVLSHRDADHTGGARAVLAMQPQAALLSSIEPQHELQAIRRATRCEQGQQWDWDGVRFEILHPLPADYAASPRPNAISCVLRIGNGRATVLLVGDIEQPQEARLVADGAPLAADLLLVPHHGSKTSSSDAFLDAVHPGIAIAQAGYRNRFGHPAPPVLQRYAERRIRVVQSASCGAAGWRSETAGTVACERQRQARYWHHVPP